MKMAKKILVIDDEPNVVRYLTTLFQDHGFDTCATLNADEGYKKAIEEHPDLITLDLLMPDKTGIKLYRELKKDENLRKIPVIVVTGFTPDQFPMINFKKFIYERSIPGPEGYIEKPIDPDLLLKTVRNALEQ
jgi:CheY-like chemotaxis protein